VVQRSDKARSVVLGGEFEEYIKAQKKLDDYTQPTLPIMSDIAPSLARKEQNRLPTG
jgi:hypothetical protein